MRVAPARRLERLGDHVRGTGAVPPPAATDQRSPAPRGKYALDRYNPPNRLALYEARLNPLWERLVAMLGIHTTRVLLQRAIRQAAQCPPALALIPYDDPTEVVSLLFVSRTHKGARTRNMVKRIFWLLAAAALLGLAVAARVSSNQMAAYGATSSTFSVSYIGTDYYIPAPTLTGCPRWTWLTSCYTNTSATRTAQQQVSADAAFIAQNGQGAFQRVWVSLDELVSWDRTTGYQGFTPQYLANLDDALARFHAKGIQVDLVLFEGAPNSGDQHQFHPEALDGNHAAMRANNLQAVQDFFSHLAPNRTDAETVAVMDLQNEAYYQMERYFRQGRSYLGTFTACWTGLAVNSGCVDQN